MSRRRLPPLASDADRLEAARIAADLICAELRDRELRRAAWTASAPTWNHYIDSVGGVHSELAA